MKIIKKSYIWQNLPLENQERILVLLGEQAQLYLTHLTHQKRRDYEAIKSIPIS